MKIDTCKLRAADAFRAKGDIRNYLNGIRINNNYIQATNGHIAIQMDSGVKTRLDVIVRFKGKIPPKSQKTKLEFSKGKNIAYHYDSLGELISAQVFDIEDGKYPQFERIIPEKMVKGSQFPPLNIDYMAVIKKAFPRESFMAVRPINYDKNKAVIYEVTEFQKHLYGNPVIIIMPTRWVMNK
jgi:hypothetical protein